MKLLESHHREASMLKWKILANFPPTDKDRNIPPPPPNRLEETTPLSKKKRENKTSGLSKCDKSAAMVRRILLVSFFVLNALPLLAAKNFDPYKVRRNQFLLSFQLQAFVLIFDFVF